MESAIIVFIVFSITVLVLLCITLWYISYHIIHTE